MAITISVLLSIILTLCYFLEKQLCIHVWRKHIDQHDIGNVLTVAMGGIEYGMIQLAKNALNNIYHINKGYADKDKQRINLGKLIKTISRVLEIVIKDVNVFMDSNVQKFTVVCVPSIMSTILTNLLKNAMEATTNGYAMISSHDQYLVITNEATERDMICLMTRQGSTKGIDRGYGCESVEILLNEMNVKLTYKIEDTKVKTILDFSDGDIKDDLEW